MHELCKNIVGTIRSWMQKICCRWASLHWLHTYSNNKVSKFKRQEMCRGREFRCRALQSKIGTAIA